MLHQVGDLFDLDKDNCTVSLRDMLVFIFFYRIVVHEGYFIVPILIACYMDSRCVSAAAFVKEANNPQLCVMQPSPLLVKQGK